MTIETKRRVVACPQCGKLSPWSSTNPHRPFCSERCKLIDFGQWATETYRIPHSETGPDPGQSDGND
ncbi:MAG: DNA gyrase inhibitor YacG [Proteobacteria bacterium]|nr:MAG: DNA gyrase inhibitor YacG [Pseudomonadota bacterium]